MDETEQAENKRASIREQIIEYRNDWLTAEWELRQVTQDRNFWRGYAWLVTGMLVVAIVLGVK